MDLNIALIVFTLCLIENCLTVSNVKHFRKPFPKNNTNPTALRDRKKIVLEKQGLFKCKFCNRNQQGALGLLFQTSQGSTPGSVTNAQTASTPAATSAGPQSTAGAASMPSANRRRKNRRRKGRKGQRRRRRKNRSKPIARLNLILQRQHFQRYYRSAIRSGHRRVNRRPGNKARTGRHELRKNSNNNNSRYKDKKSSDVRRNGSFFNKSIKA